MTMNILYIYAHPCKDSFNFQLKKAGSELLEAAGHTVLYSNLYDTRFKAVANGDDFLLPSSELESQYFLSQKVAYSKNALAADIQTEIEKLTQAEHVIFQFPLWWFSVPAILKGWMDRVLVKGFAYDSGKMLANGLLKGKTASLVVTTQSGEATFEKSGSHGATIEDFLLPIHHTLRFAGFEILSPFVEYEVFNLDEPRQKNIIENFEHYLKNFGG